jgi:uncharacterized protein YcfL
MKRRLVVVAALAMLAGCHRSESIQLVSHQPVPAGLAQKMAPASYDRLYAEAALSKNWKPIQTAPGRIRASITIRQSHDLTVEIDYSATEYTLVVVSSENLNQENGTIHPAANKAIRGLRDAIDTALARAAL